MLFGVAAFRMRPSTLGLIQYLGYLIPDMSWAEIHGLSLIVVAIVLFSLYRRVAAVGAITPVLWIETDDNAYTDITNCMLLAAMPGTVNDGAVKTITNTVGGSGTQSTRVGAAPGTKLRRFLVGPKECEITGIDTTPDGRSLFVNIQHPGENGNPGNITSHWPASQANPAAADRPRSATIVITKDDGGVIAL